MRYFLSFFFLWISLSVFSNVIVYFDYAVFNAPSSKPYLETYLTLSGNTVKYIQNNKQYQASVNISWKIFKGTELVKSSTYNLLSPLVNDTLSHPSFIDNQRFFLENGDYTVELSVIDNAEPKKITSHTEKIVIQFKREKKIYSSDIQVLESFSKTKTLSNFSKNGFDLIPYTVNYFPSTQNTLKFYLETYNTDTLFGSTSKFVYSYYVENSETFVKQPSLVGFQKQTANKVNPLLTQLDLSDLSSGNYNLVIELKDSANIIQLQKKWFFQRQSSAKEYIPEDIARKNITSIEDFFNSFSSTDSLKMFVECLWPRSTTKEREWQQTQIKNRKVNLMRSYLVDYWKAEAADSLNPLKIWVDYYKSVLEANALLKCGKQKGYYTDRGRVYLQYGKPDQRNQINSEPNSYPYEIWQYYRLYDKSTGRFFTNKKFVFANFAIADDCYKLIHSDVRGEIYDERWKFKLLNRAQQTNDLDATEPTKTYGNNIDDNFNNPR